MSDADCNDNRALYIYTSVVTDVAATAIVVFTNVVKILVFTAKRCIEVQDHATVTVS